MKNQQVISLLLCALLSSTLAHDYLRAKHLGTRHRAPKLISPLQERDSAPQQCTYVCNNTGPYPGNPLANVSLQLIVNANATLVGIVNVTAHVGLIIDIEANLVGIFNASSGAVIVINLQTQTGIYITGTQSNAGWLSSKECFQTYFKSLTTLQIFLNLNVGITFNISTVSIEISTILGQLLIQLSSQISLQIQGNISLSLSILIQVTTSIVTLLRGNLKGFLQFAGTGLIKLYGDLLWFSAVLEGFGLIFGSISGGLSALITAKVKFDLALLFAATNGIELLINVLLAVVAQVDLSILASILNSAENLLAVFVKLGGNISIGVTGVLKIIYLILLFSRGQIKIEELLGVIIEFGVYKKAGAVVDISVFLDGLVKVVEIQNATYPSSTQLTAFISLVVQLQAGTLIVNGISISVIISILTATVTNVLQLVITILLNLTIIVQVYISISTLLLYILKLLNTQAGLLLVASAIPELNIDISIAVGGNILKQLLAGITWSYIAAYLVPLRIVALLQGLPVIGTLYTQISIALNAASDGKYSLSDILQSSASLSIVTEIVAYFTGIYSDSISSTTTLTPTLTTRTISVKKLIESDTGINPVCSKSHKAHAAHGKHHHVKRQ